MLICCSLKYDDKIEEYWLLEQDFTSLKSRIDYLHSLDYTFVSFGVSAEASSFLSMDLYAPKYNWICLMAEFRCLTNHNHELQYGNHLVDGKVKKIFPPRGYGKPATGKIKHSYAEAAYKFCGEIVDTEHKNVMRDICIRGDVGEIEENREDIQTYCTSDLKYLKPILQKMVKHYKEYLTKKDIKKLKSDMLWRGETMARTALMERKGYPIDFNTTKNFSDNIQDILNACCADINSQFPEMGVFLYDWRKGKYTRKEKPIRDWIDTLPFKDRWEVTKKGKKYALSLDAFGAHFHFRHDYPRGNFGAQMLRFLKLKQSLNGFSIRKGKKNFWSSVGKDRRSRPYLNPYGSQSARYQPPSTGFLFLKPAWMRTLCVPPKGRMIVGTDYKSQEFFLKALQSKDMKMIRAYLTGDVYTAFGHDSGVMPKGSNKKTHPILRQACKASVLGISYNMTCIGLAAKLTADLGKEVTEDEAQEYIDMFEEAYHVAHEYGLDYLEEFSDNGYDRLADGWIMFGDNENFRSVGNYPTQGLGSCILRRAIAMAQDKGIDVCVPLHDAAYAEVALNDWNAVRVFNECMVDAFAYYFEGEMKDYAEKIILDCEVWSPELEEGSKQVGPWKVSVEKLHVDERAGNEYEQFKEYFKAPEWKGL